MAFRESDIRQFQTVFGHNLLAEVANFVAPPQLVVTMEDIWPLFKDHFPSDAVPYFVQSMERAHLEKELAQFENISSIVGLGGGQAIDAAKYVNWRLGYPLFQFPTSLSVDAVFGHRAGIRENSIVKYVGWSVPETIYLDLGILQSAPRHLNTGGIGDVFCFFTGVMDWRYARDRGKCEAKWPYDEDLAAISLGKAETALSSLEDIKAMTPQGVRVMVEALKWGGASYHGAGWCPRHIEGIEHFIFYALEAGTKKKFLHGQAVCLGLILGCLMHGQRAQELLKAVHFLEVDIRPEAMDITWADVSDALFGLRDFARKENFPYGIAHDFEVTEAFLRTSREFIEDQFGAWNK